MNLVSAMLHLMRRYDFRAGSGGARFTTESLQLYDELEKALSDFKGTEVTLLFNTVIWQMLVYCRPFVRRTRRFLVTN